VYVCVCERVCVFVCVYVCICVCMACGVCGHCGTYVSAYAHKISHKTQMQILNTVSHLHLPVSAQYWAGGCALRALRLARCAGPCEGQQTTAGMARGGHDQVPCRYSGPSVVPEWRRQQLSLCGTRVCCILCVRVYVCVHVCMCVRACLHACVHVCARVLVCMRV
jgi:hypothetical protein